MAQSDAFENGPVLASVVLQQLHDSAPADRICVGWVIKRLRRRWFAMLLLLLTIPGMVPGICSFAELLMAILAVQMLIGYAAPLLPRALAERPLPVRQLRRILPHAIPVLRLCERIIRPRWPSAVAAIDRIVGGVVLLLSIRLLLVPIPFSNVLPTVTIALISLATLEKDGVLLSVALVAGLTVLAIDAALVAGIIRGAAWF